MIVGVSFIIGFVFVYCEVVGIVRMRSIGSGDVVSFLDIYFSVVSVIVFNVGVGVFGGRFLVFDVGLVVDEFEIMGVLVVVVVSFVFGIGFVVGFFGYVVVCVYGDEV